MARRPQFIDYGAVEVAGAVGASNIESSGAGTFGSSTLNAENLPDARSATKVNALSDVAWLEKFWMTNSRVVGVLARNV